MNTSEQKTASMPAPKTADPKLPRLAEVPAFTEWMSQGWADPERTPAATPDAATAAALHRSKLSAALPGVSFVVASGWAPVRSNDCFYDFRPHSDFLWLTNCSAEGAVLVGTPAGGGHDFQLFVPAPALPGDPKFFTSAAHGELWVGAAHGPTHWEQALGLPTAPMTALDNVLARLSGAEAAGNLSASMISTHGLKPSATLSRTLSELRLLKDPWEITELRNSVTHTIEGFSQVINQIPTAIEGGGERWLQGTFDRVARTYGHGPGYATIVGSAHHAPTLHWVRCDGPVVESEMLLLDMGVEESSFYTADVTRTFPANGKFTTAQREVHDLVEKSHRAGLAQIAPGKDFTDFHTAIMEVIANGLSDWGMLPVSVDEALSPTGQHHRRWLVCGVGHHLGLDVHDCASASYEEYQGAKLQENMVLTVEPGLYFHKHDEMVPPELRGMGVRLEDDLLVTASGHENLSDPLPIDAAGIEAWMAAQAGNKA
ncbi:aminopeptidase P family protein [Arthrobacter sp. MYb227]|uniref:aminopeptidase P family protein n=1 Tax=Arthrobacter sp. MYb227 TaxID=1848601 RepID=UPI002156FA8A|nr:aminopeptidase P family protein [Arthrobacter sp. MYb227]